MISIREQSYGLNVALYNEFTLDDFRQLESALLESKQKIHLNRSVIGTAAMLCLFYAVTHLPLATGVTLSYTSSIFLAVFSFLILKERIAFYTTASA